MSPSEVQVRMLGGFELTVDGRPRDLPPSAERLVAYLALQHHPVLRSQAAGVLWADRDEQRAAACLRSAVWRVNSGPGLPVIEAGRSRLSLGADIAVDARDAATAAHNQIAGGAPVDVEALRGLLLPGWYEDWVLAERERLRQLSLEAMEQLAQSLLDAGQVRLAIEAALSVVAAEPLRESAHRVLIDAHVASGNRSEALRQFDRARTILDDELGLPPGAGLVAAAARAHGPAAVTQAARDALRPAVHAHPRAG